VPRVFEKVYNTARQTAQADGRAAIFDRAERGVELGYTQEDIDKGRGYPG